MPHRTSIIDAPFAAYVGVIRASNGAGLTMPTLHGNAESNQSLGPLGRVFGLLLLTGLTGLVLGVWRNGVWFLAHDQPLVFLLGAVCAPGALVWLGVMIRGSKAWIATDRILVVLVGAALSLVLVLLS